MQVEQTQNMFEVGDRGHHWRTGRTGTVIGVHENGWQIDIEFDEFNAEGMEDGLTEKRNRHAFISIPAPKRPCTKRKHAEVSSI